METGLLIRVCLVWIGLVSNGYNKSGQRLLLCNSESLGGLAAAKGVEVKVLPTEFRLPSLVKVPLQLRLRPEPGALRVHDDRIPRCLALPWKHLEAIRHQT